MSGSVIGVDFGTGGVRVVVVDSASGQQIAASQAGFPRWEAGEFCDPGRQVFRQHPGELIISFRAAVTDALAKLPPEDRESIRAISVDTTGSSPTAIGPDGLPLALSKEFEAAPEAMLVLWKDHSAEAEALEIEEALGEPFSSEWFWAKVLAAKRRNPQLAQAAITWAEHADWFPAFLCRNNTPESWRRCRSGASHKALWRPEEGYPSAELLGNVDPYLSELRGTLGVAAWSPESSFGGLAEEEGSLLGLPAGLLVGVGSFDAHTAALAGGARPGTLVKIIGTSSSDMVVTDLPGDTPLPGVESAALGSIVSGLTTIESGQAAYGDLTSWLVDLLLYGVASLDREAARRRLFGDLEAAAREIPVDSAPVSLDWLNGRRSPYEDLSQQGALAGLSLGTGAPALYLSLLEAAAFGTRAVHEHYASVGVTYNELVVLGGVPDRSPLAMRVLAEVLNTSVSIRESANASAQGAAIYAAVVGGVYPDALAAQEVMKLGERTRVTPDPSRARMHKARYRRYQTLARIQQETASRSPGAGHD